MKLLAVVFICLVFGFFASVAVVGGPLVAAQAEVINAPPDPYQQLLDSRAADSGDVPVFVPVVLLVIFSAGIGWYALSDRTTKALKAARALRKPVRRTTRVQPLPRSPLPEVQDVPTWASSPQS